MEGVHHNLGNLAYAEGRVDDAIRAFRRTLELNPRFAEARNNLGQALEARGQDEEALAEYEQAVQDAEFWIHTDDPVGGAWYNLARIADRLDRPSQAIDAYRQTIQHLQGGDEYSRFVEFARKRVVSLADGGAR
jgi:tetratricopeptide (TPR) repeat protein